MVDLLSHTSEFNPLFLPSGYVRLHDFLFLTSLPLC